MATLPSAKLLPWGRLVLQPATHNKSLPDHHELLRSKHCLGRVANRCDIYIPKKFISGLHCIIRLQGKDAKGEPIVEIEDVSRYGVWVNSKKVGTRRKTRVEKGDLLHLTPPGSKEVPALCYKLEILPSGLTFNNEELHARLSADEMAVAGRTRKRTHEETQCTQSPSRLVPSPLNPRPAKLQRVLSIPSDEQAAEEEGEPVSEPSNTPSTQQTGSEKVSQQASSGAAAKRRRPLDAPELDSRLAELKEEHENSRRILTDLVVVQLKELEVLRKEKSLEKTAQEELAILRKENESLKKTREEERQKLDQAKAELDKHVDVSNKNLDELRQERDLFKKTLQAVLADSTTPSQVRTVVELEAKIEMLRRSFKTAQAELAIQDQHVPTDMTPPSKKQLIEIERKNHLARILPEKHQEVIELLTFVLDKVKAELKLIKSVSADESNSSGSSQSQDSLRGNPRSSLLSVTSNEHSEPSPLDVSLTLDEETKSGDTSQGYRPLFNIYGAVSIGSGIIRPTTLSAPQAYRASVRIRMEDQETKGQDVAEAQETEGQEAAAEDEETKGQEETAEDEETKGQEETAEEQDGKANQDAAEEETKGNN